MSNTLRRLPASPPRSVRGVATTWALRLVALAIALSSAYGLLGAHPYRDLPEATVLAAKA